jgi:uncharacterized protein (DUF1810 family)
MGLAVIRLIIESPSFATAQPCPAALCCFLVALQNLAGVTAEAVFGAVDATKLRSSLTLFAEAGGGPVCEVALKRWFGSPDDATLRLLGRQRH